MVYWREDGWRRRKVLQIRVGYELFRQKGQESGSIESMIRIKAIEE
jgi:hypothetical protein